MSAQPPKNSFVPPIITTTTAASISKPNMSEHSSSDFVEFTASIDDILQGQGHTKQHTTTTAYAVDDSITEDTSSIDYDTELEYSIADDDDIDASSSSSSHPNEDEDSTRRLLKQAHQRLNHQSIYEEVKLLRMQLSQNLEIVNKCNLLEQQLHAAHKTIEMLQIKEKRHEEELAKREVEFMKKLNDMCAMMEVEIVKRDERIVELQERLNEKELIKLVI